ncbi:metallophosphoesterase [Virgisporangium aliadipatigenens]|nr:metallophosphoesterase [Virgisporangium aliadipatigenens]
MSADVVQPARRSLVRPLLFGLILITLLGLLFGVPWWTLVAAGQWPTGVFVAGTALFAVAVLAFPVLMFRGHARGNDGATVTADVLLGAIWVLFTWSVIGNLLRLALIAAGVEDPTRSRAVAVSVTVISAVLLIWGNVEAMRIPRIRRVTVDLPRLAPGLDGTKVVLITDTHYGPIDRVAWSKGVTEAVNALEPDIVCHTGDIADGSVEQRRDQAAPLADIRAKLARTYVTGNHEYFGEADVWMTHMRDLGWEALHNRHIVVERDGASLVIAGVDDRTAKNSRLPGHRADHATALAGADPDLPVLLLAHQPKQIDDAVAHGVDLQLSGHTHGGQIWPFSWLVRLDQPVVQGLSRHGARTQLYTSRGTGFWGPPFRVFAPSEITELTLRSGAA